MEKKKLVGVIIIAIIISIVKELIFTYILKMASNYYIDRIIISTIIFSFIGLHFVVEIRKLYDFIIKHRYKITVICIILFSILQYSGSSNGIMTLCVLEPEKNNTIWGKYNSIRSDEYGVETPLAISQSRNNFSYFNEFLRGTKTDVFSVVHAPVKDILSIGKLFNLGYFLNSGFGIAFAWNLRFYLLLLASYELFYILTNEKKYYSLVGAVLITFSGAVQWQFSNALIDIIISGEIALVLLNKFLQSNSFKIRSTCLIGIIICAITYVFTFYPPFMIAFGYVFLSLAIWIIIKNKDKYKFSVKDILVVIICIAFMGYIFLRYVNLSKDTLNILSNTSYPGNRISNGGKGIGYLFSWVITPFLKTINFGDNCVVASVISLFPLPSIYAIYCVKNKKHLSFFVPILIATTIETIFVIIGLIISKALLLNYTTVDRVAVAINFANVYMLFYAISNFEGKRITDESKNIILVCLLIVGIYSGIGVNPITKSVDGITQTTLAHKIQEMTLQEEGLWISTDDILGLANYAVANGAKVLNSSNIYPNKDFFVKALGTVKAEEQKDIWNRYCHIKIVIDNDCYVEEKSKDIIVLHTTAEKIKELGVEYIITYSDKAVFENDGLELETIYEKVKENYTSINGENINSIYIYKIKDIGV